MDRPHDDFWGDTPDWSDQPRRRPAERAGRDITGQVRRLWNGVLDSGASATREHRRLDLTAQPTDPTPTAANPADPFADWPDDDWASDDWAAAHAVPGEPMRTAGVPAARDEGAHLIDAAAAPGRPDLDAPDAPRVADVHEHHDAPTTEVPVVRAGAAAAARLELPADDEWGRSDDPNAAASVDPRVVRAGALAIIITLLVPLIIGLRSGGDDLDVLAGADTSTTAPAAVVPAASEPTTTVLDPASLPPAVPRNTVSSGGASTASSTGAESGGDSASSSGGTTGDASATAALVVDETTTTADAALDERVSAGETAARQELTCAIDYEVVAGDFWLRIAEGAGVTLAELLEANGATTSTPMFPGQSICLPAGASVPPPPPAPTTAAPTTAAPTTAAPTTSATTTTTTTTAPRPPAGPDEIVQIIRDVWPDDLEDRALEIAYRESRYVPTAKNFCCYGLFQIYWEVHDVWLDDLGITSASQLFDPETNARAAYALYQRAGGWGPWGF